MGVSMDDAEAEAVLKIISEPLIWRTYHDSEARANAKGGFYQVIALPLRKRIGRRTRYYVARWYLEGPQGAIRPEGHQSPHPYEHKVDGRNACERHYATGRWSCPES